MGIHSAKSNFSSPTNRTFKIYFNLAKSLVSEFRKTYKITTANIKYYSRKHFKFFVKVWLLHFLQILYVISHLSHLEQSYSYFSTRRRKNRSINRRRRTCSRFVCTNGFVLLRRSIAGNLDLICNACPVIFVYSIIVISKEFRTEQAKATKVREGSRGCRWAWWMSNVL